MSPLWVEQMATLTAGDGSTFVDPELRAKYANTVYPCKTCRPTLFYRWVQKHYGPDHSPDHCGACQESTEGRRRRSRGSSPQAAELPERKDLA